MLPVLAVRLPSMHKVPGSTPCTALHNWVRQEEQKLKITLDYTASSGQPGLHEVLFKKKKKEKNRKWEREAGEAGELAQCYTSMMLSAGITSTDTKVGMLVHICNPIGGVRCRDRQNLEVSLPGSLAEMASSKFNEEILSQKLR